MTKMPTEMPPREVITEAAIEAMRPGDTIKEDSALPGEQISVHRGERGHWTVRLGIGGVSLAKSARRAMVYVRDRRRLARREQKPVL